MNWGKKQGADQGITLKMDVLQSLVVSARAQARKIGHAADQLDQLLKDSSADSAKIQAAYRDLVKALSFDD